LDSWRRKTEEEVVMQEAGVSRGRAWVEVGEEEGGLKKTLGFLLSAATNDPPDS